MAKGVDSADTVTTLLRRSADEERRLLKRERRAEREVLERRDRLADERAHLERARARVERGQAELEEAETRLRERQAARAAGPQPVEADEVQPPEEATESTQAADRLGAKTASRNGKTRLEIDVTE